MNKSTLNYWVDVAIGISGALSAVTGLVMLLPANSASEILGIGLRLWSGMHTWSSLAAVAGVGAHLALHWKWATAMTGQVLAISRRRAGPATGAESAPAAAGGSALSRRAFLALGGLAALAVGLAAAGYKAVAGAAGGGGAASDSAAASMSLGSGIACPRGLIDDPYPGQCRHYVDADGDGICDYSVAGSGSQVAGGFGAAPGGSFPGRPSGSWRP